MSIASDVVDNLAGTGEGLLAVDDPLPLIERAEEAVDGLVSLQLKVATNDGSLQMMQELPPEEASQYIDVDEKVFP